MYIITIDTGTTNTRVCAWQDQRLLAEAARPIGVRDTAISGSTATLMNGVREAVQEAKNLATIPAAERVVYLSSGMITSNVGLCEIPHLLAPAGLGELAQGMVCANLPEIAEEPIWFVPGVRNHDSAVTLGNAEQMDMMRGEETEAIGVLASLDIHGPALIVLPGSHSKFVKIDAQDRIEGCVTTLGGELLDVITRHTILANSWIGNSLRRLKPQPCCKVRTNAGKRACPAPVFLCAFWICSANLRSTRKPMSC